MPSRQEIYKVERLDNGARAFALNIFDEADSFAASSFV